MAERWFGEKVVPAAGFGSDACEIGGDQSNVDLAGVPFRWSRIQHRILPFVLLEALEMALLTTASYRLRGGQVKALIRSSLMTEPSGGQTDCYAVP